jgi:SagB-type dehydrogenase family enzyme
VSALASAPVESIGGPDPEAPPRIGPLPRAQDPETFGRWRMSPAARLVAPGAVSGPRWTAENLRSGRRFALRAPAVLLMLACAQPRLRADAIDRVAERLRASRDLIHDTFDALAGADLLVPADRARRDPWLRASTELRRTWAGRGWAEAAEYYVATHDLDSYGYNNPEALRLMETYARSEPDRNRVKRDPADRPRVSLPRPDPPLVAEPMARALEDVDRTGSRRWQYRDFAAALSVTFGRTGLFETPVWSDTALLQRTSPSGGARHPTEAYVLAFDVPGLDPGRYHVAIEAPELVRLGRLERSVAGRLTAELARAALAFPARALVVLCSLFERSMWRYREPRVFRVVHMDAGHLATTFRLAAGLRGIRSTLVYGLDDRSVELAVGVDGLSEGHIVSVAVG